VPEHLLHQVAEGNPQAVRELLNRYGGLVYALARRFSLDQSEVDDAVQDVFTALWQNAGRFDPRIAGEDTFVAMVARRRLIDRRRRALRRNQGRVDADTALTPDHSSQGSAGGGGAEESQRVLSLMGTLRPEQQTCLRLSIDGKSHEQIARITGLPLGTVKTHVRRGLIALRDALEKQRSGTASGPAG
jgi:RNA polymerase sigma factor (sigma-70 family)